MSLCGSFQPARPTAMLFRMCLPLSLHSIYNLPFLQVNFKCKSSCKVWHVAYARLCSPWALSAHVDWPCFALVTIYPKEWIEVDWFFLCEEYPGTLNLECIYWSIIRWKVWGGQKKMKGLPSIISFLRRGDNIVALRGRHSDKLP